MNRPPEDSFLGRWSKRKLAEPETEEAHAEDGPQGPDEALAEKSDEEILQELGLPDPDSLEDGDDFKRFMASAVPQRLRNRALRKLWLTNPVLANLDELVDYGEDYTDAATVVENLQTAYQVGKGWLKDKIEDAEDGEDGPQGPDEPEAEAALHGEDQPGEARAQDEVEPETVQEFPAPHVEDIPQGLDEPVAVAVEPEPAPVPRRMRFRFEQG